MFGIKKPPITNVVDRFQAAKYDCVLQALKDIVKLDVKSGDANDCAMSISTIKMRARIALDFVGNLEKNDDDD